MKLILLSGGSGKRLWPLSNDARSKQFLKLLTNEEGVFESMIQRVWRQLKSVGLEGSSIITTNKLQVELLQNQLGNSVPLVVEPSRRGTFPAIALTIAYLHFYGKVKEDEVVVVLPVDPYVNPIFFEKVKELEAALLATDADLALIGVAPTLPSENYGYIVPEEIEFAKGIIKVKKFTEKPKEEQAISLIKQKALWNCGIFAFKLGYVLSYLKFRGYPTNYDELYKQFQLLPNNSFDFEVVEKASKVIAIPYHGEWKDLGAWNSLTEELPENQIGLGTVDDTCINTHLINELDIPIIVHGISNVVIAAGFNGILVTEKTVCHQIKGFVENFANPPRFEERRWGWNKVLDYTKFDEGNEVLTKRICVLEGKNLSFHQHSKRREIWTLIKGEGEFAYNNSLYSVKAGDVLLIPIGVQHGIKAITDLEIIEVQTGEELMEDDIMHIFMTWEETVSHCLMVNIFSGMKDISSTFMVQNFNDLTVTPLNEHGTCLEDLY